MEGHAPDEKVTGSKHNDQEVDASGANLATHSSHTMTSTHDLPTTKVSSSSAAFPSAAAKSAASHVYVYAIADYYDLPSLTTLALRKFAGMQSQMEARVTVDTGARHRTAGSYYVHSHAVIPSFKEWHSKAKYNAPIHRVLGRASQVMDLLP